MLHVVGDLVQSAGVALAGALIWYHEVWGCVGNGVGISVNT